MDWCTVIIVTDKRQAGIGAFLPGTMESCRWSGNEENCRKILQRADALVLPTPAGTVEKTEGLLDALKENLPRCTMLFGGKIDAGWTEWCSKRSVRCVDFMEDDLVAQENAKITAEATVAEILTHAGYSIRGQKIIVTGYGRCGKATADLLGAMGAKVTVFARSRDVRIMARRDGHDAVDFSYGPEEVYGAYTVVNTVPSCVLTETIIAEMHKDTVIFDIASAPGGTDLAAAEKYGIPVVCALGLPGKYTTKSSAKILADAMQRQMLQRRSIGEGKSWIFQIII